MRVGIVGCGKVADQHACQIRRIVGAELVAACDTEPLMARQICERFSIPRRFSALPTMLGEAGLDVVHLTTPPQTHFELARLCLNAGVHVYIEKPFTVDTVQAEELIRLATKNGLKLTVGHNTKFTHAMIRMRRLVSEGYLGGKPLHVESTYGYDLGDEGYAKAFLGDRRHWIRTLPGSLLQNIVSHGIGRIAEFLTGTPLVSAQGFTSPFLRRIGEPDLIDELRVVIRDQDSTTAYFTFSSQIRPIIHQLRLYGSRHSLIVDDDHQSVIELDGSEYKSYLRYFYAPLCFARQYVNASRTNVMRFAKREFHLPFDAGLKTLIEMFYRSIRYDTPLPVSYREILLTSKIMDDTFAQLNSRHTSTPGTPAALALRA